MAFVDPDWIRAEPHASPETMTGHDDPGAAPDVINRPAKRLWQDAQRLAADIVQTPELDGDSTALLDGPLEVEQHINAIVTSTGGTLADMIAEGLDPATRTQVSAVAIGQHVYLAGGATMAGAVMDSFHRYDIVADSWAALDSLPVPSSQLALVVHGGLIYAFGGTDGNGVLGSAWVYDPDDDQWQVIVPTIGFTPRRHARAVSDGTHIFVLGGNDGTQSLKTVERFDPSEADPNLAWTTMTQMVDGREEFGAAFLRRRIYAVGGRVVPGNTQLQTVEEFDPSANVWRLRAPLNTARASTACVAARGRLYVFEGFVYSSGTLVTTSERYNPAADAWAVLTNSSGLARRQHAAATTRGRVFVMGGDETVNALDDTLALVTSVHLFDSPKKMVCAPRELDAVIDDDDEVLNEATGHKGSSILALTGDGVGVDVQPEEWAVVTAQAEVWG